MQKVKQILLFTNRGTLKSYSTPKKGSFNLALVESTVDGIEKCIEKERLSLNL